MLIFLDSKLYGGLTAIAALQVVTNENDVYFASLTQEALVGAEGFFPRLTLYYECLGCKQNITCVLILFATYVRS